MVWDLLVSGVCLGLLFGLVAIGYSLIWSTMTLLHFAHGEFVTVGAFAALTLVGLRSLSGWPLAVMALVALGVGCLGILVERSAYRPIPHHSFSTRVIATVGVGEILRSSCALIWGSRSFPLPEGFFAGPPIRISGLFVPPAYYWILGVSAVLVAALIFLLYSTKLGLGLRAVCYKADVAELMGVNSNRMYIISFFLGSAVAGITGILIAPITFINYQLGIAIGIKGFAASVVGGLGNFAGAMVGGLVLGLTEAIAAWFIPAYKDVIVFLVLILAMGLKPYGLLGRAEVQKV
jgi:branched-chain amino acid transport system permease protein